MEFDSPHRIFPYRRSPDQDLQQPARRPVVIVGAGPVGLTLAIDLALQQVPVVVVDDDDRLSAGSRAICFSKRSLEIFDRLGCGDRMVAKGISWNIGKVFFHDHPVYSFNLLPEPGHARPAFINLQQYYVERYLIDRAVELPDLDIRWLNRVVGIESVADGVMLQVETPEGPYRIEADYVVACDGSRSTVRRLLGLESKGRVFRDRFLIADVKMKASFPTERWFWFDPPFHPQQSVLLHRQADDVWRIDFQLGWEADPEKEKQPERIVQRVKALLGPDVDFALGWASVYTFACQRMERFRHGRVIFAGDAAHGVSPFGARGANSGIQDAENLAWKLACVLQGRAGDALLESYCIEREAAADENILASTRSTDFITPKNEASHLFRDAALDLAREYPFARTLVNSGRLSVPATLRDSPLNTADGANFVGRMVPGAVAADAPLTIDRQPGWLLRQTRTGAFTLLMFSHDEPLIATLRAAAQGLAPLEIVPLVSVYRSSSAAGELIDVEHLAMERYDARPGTAYLLRPDQHVCARWRAAEVDPDRLHAALRRALALDAPAR